MTTPANSQNQSAGPHHTTEVAPDVLKQWMGGGDTMLVDVREDFEHAEERIPGATHAPLSRFDADQIRARAANRRVVFHCRSGKRSAQACEKYRRQGEPVMHLAGGIEAWKAAGQATEKSARAPRIPVMRQVQILAGSLVALGTLAGAFVSPWALVLPAFIGCGLVFAGASGWCGMAMMLAKMPWNRVTCPTGGEAR